MAEITIGTKFKKQVAGKKYVDCEVVDIVKKYSISRKEFFDTIYIAKSDNYALGKSFEVSSTSILKGI